jgi:hypothetical protein
VPSNYRRKRGGHNRDDTGKLTEEINVVEMKRGK